MRKHYKFITGNDSNVPLIPQFLDLSMTMKYFMSLLHHCLMTKLYDVVGMFFAVIYVSQQLAKGTYERMRSEKACNDLFDAIEFPFYKSYLSFYISSILKLRNVSDGNQNKYVFRELNKTDCVYVFRRNEKEGDAFIVQIQSSKTIKLFH